MFEQVLNPTRRSVHDRGMALLLAALIVVLLGAIWAVAAATGVGRLAHAQPTVTPVACAVADDDQRARSPAADPAGATAPIRAVR